MIKILSLLCVVNTSTKSKLMKVRKIQTEIRLQESNRKLQKVTGSKLQVGKQKGNQSGLQTD